MHHFTWVKGCSFYSIDIPDLVIKNMLGNGSQLTTQSQVLKIVYLII